MDTLVDPLTFPLFYGTSGDHSAPIALVGESWGEEEARQQVPFVGQSGRELDRMLAEAGLDPKCTFRTNVFAAHPRENDTWRFFLPNDRNPRKDSRPRLKGLIPSPFASAEVLRLHAQLAALPCLRLVIAIGNYALWALTDHLVSISSTSTGSGATVLVPGGITSWRGSMLTASFGGRSTPVLPIIHPAGILRAWYNRAITVHDLRRAPRALRSDWEPAAPPTILAPPTFATACATLCNWLATADSGTPLRLTHDIETARGLITCMGFASGPYDHTGFALVIPFVRLLPGRQFDSFWPPEEEAHLTHLIRQVLTHPNIQIEGQNYAYDTQYIRHWLGVTPKCAFDTMLAQHLLFPGTPKGLDYLSSMYCRYHSYWKDDNKEWDLRADETAHLVYNAVDVLRTYECAAALRTLVVQMGQEEQWKWEQRKSGLALRMMFRGVRIDTKRRAIVATELAAHQSHLHSRLASMVPLQFVPQLKSPKVSPWYTSPRQQAEIFYTTLGLPRQRNRKTDATTVDDEALQELGRKFPELQRLFNLLLESRSVKVFHSTFISAPLESNGRIKCSFNTAGTETFRWSSSENAFQRGTNLQNVPQGDD